MLTRGCAEFGERPVLGNRPKLILDKVGCQVLFLGRPAKRGILTVADADRCLVHIEQLLAQAIESKTDFFSMRQVLTTARTFQLSAYDAVYLDTARRERLPLASLDQRLRAAATQADIDLLGRS